MKLTKEAIGLGGLRTVTFTPSEPIQGVAAPVDKKETTDTIKPKAKPAKKPAKSPVDMTVTEISG